MRTQYRLTDGRGQDIVNRTHPFGPDADNGRQHACGSERRTRKQMSTALMRTTLRISSIAVQCQEWRPTGAPARAMDGSGASVAATQRTPGLDDGATRCKEGGS
jgi:hypothetical protein